MTSTQTASAPFVNDPEGQFANWLRRAVANLYEPRDNIDVACKIYFYPFSAVFFTTEEWEGFIEKDEITVKAHKVKWVIREGGKRLAAYVKSLRFPTETYLTVIVYGLTCRAPQNKTDNIDLLYHVQENGDLNINRMTNAKD
jgi:hypothetical protein